MAVRLATATRNALVAALAGLVDAGSGPGTLKIYTGSQPATGDTAETGTLLVSIPLGDPAFGAPAAGMLTAADPAGVAATGTGTAGWFRVEDSAGGNVYDGSVTATGGNGDLTVASTSLATGIVVDVTALTVTMPAA